MVGAMTQETETITLPIGGMTCAGCANTVERALAGTDGVVEASVNFPAETARVDFVAGALDADALAKVVSQAGYSVRQNLSTVYLSVTGMNCASCVQSVESALKARCTSIA